MREIGQLIRSATHQEVILKIGFENRSKPLSRHLQLICYESESAAVDEVAVHDESWDGDWPRQSHRNSKGI